MPTPTPAQLRVLRALDGEERLFLLKMTKSNKPTWRFIFSGQTVSMNTMWVLERNDWIRCLTGRLADAERGAEARITDAGRSTLTAAGREAAK